MENLYGISVKETSCFLLEEYEYWDERGITIGIFGSNELAEKVKIARIKYLRKYYDDSIGDFNDYYKWIISEKRFYSED